MVKTHNDFRLLLRVRNIYVRCARRVAHHFRQLLSIALELLDIAATQRHLHRTAIATATALVRDDRHLQAFDIAKAGTQLVHNLLHTALTLIGRLKAHVQRALVRRITSVADIQRHNAHLRQIADILLQRRRQLHSFVQARTNRRLHRHAELAGVIRRLKLRTHERQQQKIESQGNNTNRHDLLRSFQRPGHQTVIHLTQRLEACLELLQYKLHIFIALLRRLLLALHANPISGHHRRQGKGHNRTEGYGKGYRQAKLLEELANCLTHIANRHEHRHQRQRGRQNSQRQLLRRLACRHKRRLAHFDMTEDIFDNYNSVIYENADRQTQRHQRHIIQRKVHHAHHEKRGNYRGRNT